MKKLSVALVVVLGACAGSAKSTKPASEAKAQTAAPAPKPTYNAVPLIPRATLFGNPKKTRPMLSPDGKRLAYLAPHEGVLNIWVRPVDQEAAAEQPQDKVITNDTSRGIRIFFWAPKGDKIIYLQDQGGDENWHVYAVPALGGEAVDLTPIPNVQAQIVAVERSRPGEILVGLNDRDPRLHDVYKIDLATGKRTLVQTNELGATSWHADRAMAVRGARLITLEGGVKVMHRPGAKGALKTLTAWNAEDSMSSSVVGFAGDNRTLYVLASAGTNTTELRSIDTRTGKQTTLATDPTADVSDVLWHPKTYKAQAVAFTRARREWKVLDKDIEADMAVLAELADGDIEVVSRDDADTTWVVRYSSDKAAAVYFLYDRKTKEGNLLFSQQPELDEFELAEMQPVSYPARDGLTIHGYLTTPPKVPAKALPAVVLVHGGPWWRDFWGYSPVVQMLANRGYAVLQPNFRGSTGYGKEFLNAGNREWGGKMQDDITDGTRWLIDQGIADPKRICIMGGSYGGYATLMGLVREPDLYACGVSIVGVSNLITWMNTIPQYWIPFRYVFYQRVGNPEIEEEFLKERSPVFQVDKIKAPLLIGQGANDPRVPKDESVQIRDALQKAGRKVQYLEFADEGHGFARPENRLTFYAAAEKFLAQHLGGRAEN